MLRSHISIALDFEKIEARAGRAGFQKTATVTIVCFDDECKLFRKRSMFTDVTVLIRNLGSTCAMDHVYR